MKSGFSAARDHGLDLGEGARQFETLDLGAQLAGDLGDGEQAAHGLIAIRAFSHHQRVLPVGFLQAGDDLPDLGIFHIFDLQASSSRCVVMMSRTMMSAWVPPMFCR